MEKKKLFIFIAGLYLLAFIAYYPSVGNGYIWDDNHYVTENEQLRSFEGLKNIWSKPKSIPQYYPVVHTSYWLEYQLWGLNPMGYHIINILLHATTALLIFLLFRQLKIPLPWLAAVIFVVHPVHVESVAWITERKNTLSLFFAIASLLCFIRAINKLDDLEKVKINMYFLSLLLFILAMLSKTVVCSLPAVIIILLWWKSTEWKKPEWKICLFLIPFFIIGISLAMTTVWLEISHVGAKGVEWDTTFTQKILIANRSLFFYVSKIVFPHPLIFFYERWDLNTLFPSGLIYMFINLLALCVSIVMCKKFGKGLLAGLLIFAGILFPALGFINVYPHRYSFVADHFQYHATIVIIGIFVTALSLLLIKYKKERFIGVIAALIIIPLVAKSIHHNFDFKSKKVLWQSTVNKNPSCWAAHHNLGLILLNEKKYSLAKVHFEAALKYKDTHTQAMTQLAFIYELEKEYEKAEPYFSKAINIAVKKKENPSYLYLQRANFYARSGQFEKALKDYHQSVMLNPNQSDAYLGAGNVYMQMKNYPMAKRFYKVRLQYRPDDTFVIEKLSEINRLQKPN
ncbi:MAG: tetratricopeptide repeat protein [Lentisphaeria bacterium]|nr:tetratricopeptide repeat protein [Lentisphaeria bacterium]